MWRSKGVTLSVMLACCDSAGGIGVQGRLPWHVPAELSWFKAYTMGKVLGVGSGTRLPPLPGRDVVRLSRRGVHLKEFLIMHRDGVVIGGGQIFDACLGMVDTLKISILPDAYPCDTYLNLARIDRLYVLSGFVQHDGFQVFTYHIRRPHG